MLGSSFVCGQSVGCDNLREQGGGGGGFSHKRQLQERREAEEYFTFVCMLLHLTKANTQTVTVHTEGEF